MSEDTHDHDNLGPSGENPEDFKPKPKIDIATGYELPKEIAGIPLTRNFNSSRRETWPRGLKPGHVTEWIFSNHPKTTTRDDEDLPTGQPEVPTDRPVDADGVAHDPSSLFEKDPEAPANPNPTPTSPLDVVNRLDRIEAKLDQLLAPSVNLSPPSSPDVSAPEPPPE